MSLLRVDCAGIKNPESTEGKSTQSSGIKSEFVESLFQKIGSLVSVIVGSNISMLLMGLTVTAALLSKTKETFVLGVNCNGSCSTFDGCLVA